MAVDNATILDRIWLSGTNDYQQRVPPATQDSIAATQAALFDPRNLDLYNQFVNALVNRIGDTVIHTDSWYNPLGILKKSNLRYGDKIQEIAVKWIKAHSYDDSAEDVFKAYRPDASVWYHEVNRREFYPITVNREELEMAFVDNYGLNRFISGILEVPRNSDEYDEYRIMLELLAYYENNFGFYKQQVSALSSESTAKAFLTELRAYAGMLQFPSTLYNSGEIPDIPVFAKNDELIILMTPRTRAVIDVQALAAAFNLDYENIQQRIILIDEFPIPDAVALLTTVDFFQSRDKLYTTTSSYNPKTLGTNYFLHHWSMHSVSPFAPAILFTTSSSTSIDTITATYSTALSLSPSTKTAAAGTSFKITPTFAPTSVVDGSSNAYTNSNMNTNLSGYDVSIVGTLTTGTGQSATTSGVDVSSCWYDKETNIFHIGSDIASGSVIVVTFTPNYVNPSNTTDNSSLGATCTITIS